MTTAPIASTERIWLDESAERDFYVMLDVYELCIRKAVDNEVFNLDDTLIARLVLTSFVTVLRSQQAEIQTLRAKQRNAATSPSHVDTNTPHPA